MKSKYINEIKLYKIKSKCIKRNIPSFFLKREIRRLKNRPWGRFFPSTFSFFACLQIIVYPKCIYTLYGSLTR